MSLLGRLDVFSPLGHWRVPAAHPAEVLPAGWVFDRSLHLIAR